LRGDACQHLVQVGRVHSLARAVGGGGLAREVSARQGDVAAVDCTSTTRSGASN
jgi:hypothetical protein